MDTRTRRTIYSNLFKVRFDDDINKRGLITLLKANAEIARERSLYRSDAERVTAMLMSRPVEAKKAFGLFGLIFGSMPLLTAVVKILAVPDETGSGAGIWACLFATAAIVTGGTGYFLGRIIPDIVNGFSNFRLPNRIALIALVGLLWGGTAGAAGGLFLFVVGAILGGILGGIAGFIALPLLVAFYSALRAGDLIEIKHLLPFAFGVTLTLCAFILGL
jgi:hypothetical protein